MNELCLTRLDVQTRDLRYMSRTGWLHIPLTGRLNDPLMHADCLFIIMKDVGIFLRGNHQKQRLDVMIFAPSGFTFGWFANIPKMVSPLLAGDNNCQAVLCPDPLPGRVLRGVELQPLLTL